MVPETQMLVTKNRVGVSVVWLLAILGFLAACAPPGHRALWRGRELLEAGKTEAAVVELKTATSLLPTNAVAWSYLGLACHRAGQLTNAVEAYSRALRLDRDLLEARYNLGCLLLDEGNVQAALAEFTAYTLRRSQDPDGWLKLGETQLRGREFAEAERSFRESLRIEVNQAGAWNGLGQSQWQRNRLRDAAESFGQALNRQPDYGPALLNLATVSQQLNERGEALRLYREYLALEPRAGDWDAVNGIVQSLLPPADVQQHPAAAPVNPVTNKNATIAPVTNASKASAPLVRVSPAGGSGSNPIATKPGSTSASVVQPSPVFVKSGSEPASKAVPDEPHRTIPNSSASPRPRGPTDRIAEAERREPRDSTSKQASIRSKPAPVDRDGSPRVGLSATLRGTAPGRYAYLSPPAGTPGNRRGAEAAFVQGQQAQANNRLAEALQSFRRASELDPAYYEAYYSQGLVAFSMRSYEVALGAWEKALALRPNDADARYNFGLTLKAADYTRDAVAELEKLLAMHPDEARGHLTLGNIYAEQLRDIPKARRHYNKVLQLDPANPQAQAIRYWLVANPG